MLILCLIIHWTMTLLSNNCYIAQYMRCHRIINMMNISKIFLKFWQLPRPLTTSWPHPCPLATSLLTATPPGHLLAVDLIILWPAYLVTLTQNSDLQGETLCTLFAWSIASSGEHTSESLWEPEINVFP